MNRVIILMYHIIDKPLAPEEEKYCCTPENFEKQMRYLHRSGYTPVPLDKFVDMLDGKDACPEHSVVITFDDGFECLVNKALPVLQKYDIPSTVFVPSDLIGDNNAWMHNRGFPRRRLLTKPQLLELSNAGVSIGSHTRTHVRLTDISNDRLGDEINTSKKILEDAVGCKVDYFAYPYGLYNEQTLAVVKRAGYRAACSTRSGFNRLNIDRYALRRIEIYGSDSIWIFRQKLRFGTNDASFLFTFKYYAARLIDRLKS